MHVEQFATHNTINQTEQWLFLMEQITSPSKASVPTEPVQSSAISSHGHHDTKVHMKQFMTSNGTKKTCFWKQFI
jgi:hypothetical protein